MMRRLGGKRRRFYCSVRKMRSLTALRGTDHEVFTQNRSIIMSVRDAETWGRETDKRGRVANSGQNQERAPSGVSVDAASTVRQCYRVTTAAFFVPASVVYVPVFFVVYPCVHSRAYADCPSSSVVHEKTILSHVSWHVSVLAFCCKTGALLETSWAGSTWTGTEVMDGSRSLFELACRINHSCLPNCRCVSSGLLLLAASIDIDWTLDRC